MTSLRQDASGRIYDEARRKMGPGRAAEGDEKGATDCELIVDGGKYSPHTLGSTF